MRNRIFGWIMTVGFVAGGGEVAAQEPQRQGPQEEGVVLRFDEARRDTLADGSRTVVCDSPIRHGANGCDC